MINKLEYIKFIMLITIRSNIVILENEIRRNMSWIEGLKDLNSDAVREYTENIRQFTTQIEFTYELLRKMYSLDSIKCLDILIEKEWSNILNGLCNGKYDYRWELKDFSVVATDEITKQIKEYYDIIYRERIFKKTRYYYNTPLYIDMKYLMVIDNNHDGVPKKIYKDIIDNSLFDPNMNRSGISDEYFWTRQPDPFGFGDKDYTEFNKKVICDKRTNYHLLQNGSDLLEWYIRRASNNYKITGNLSNEDRYYLEIISYVFRNNNCSLLDTFRDNGNWNLDLESYIAILFKKNFIDTNVDIIDDLRDYCLARKCINKQIEIAKYPSIPRNFAIDTYIRLIEERYNNSLNEEVKKLEKLKI